MSLEEEEKSTLALASYMDLAPSQCIGHIPSEEVLIINSCDVVHSQVYPLPHTCSSQFHITHDRMDHCPINEDLLHYGAFSFLKKLLYCSLDPLEWLHMTNPFLYILLHQQPIFDTIACPTWMGSQSQPYPCLKLCLNILVSGP